MPVRCGVTELEPVDTDRLAEERKQIWVEARNYLLNHHDEALQMPKHLMPTWQRMIEDARMVDATIEQCDAWLDCLHPPAYQEAHRSLSWNTGYVARVDPIALWHYALNQHKSIDNHNLDKLKRYLEGRSDFQAVEGHPRFDNRRSRGVYERLELPQ